MTGQSRTSRARFSALDAFLIALILAIVVKLTLFSTFKVEGDSMLPSLHPGDLILCVKPFLFSRTAFNPKTRSLRMVRNLNRGDIVVFKPSTFPDTEYVKRVIALSGETLAITGAEVLIDGRRLEENYLAGTPQAGKAEEIRISVPPGTLFVMGDNREHSQDSRVIGPVAESNIEARCVAIYKPFKHFRVFRRSSLPPRE